MTEATGLGVMGCDVIPTGLCVAGAKSTSDVMDSDVKLDSVRMGQMRWTA